jgi:hypothetical protein
MTSQQLDTLKKEAERLRDKIAYSESKRRRIGRSSLLSKISPKPWKKLVRDRPPRQRFANKRISRGLCWSSAREQRDATALLTELERLLAEQGQTAAQSFRGPKTPTRPQKARGHQKCGRKRE